MNSKIEIIEENEVAERDTEMEQFQEANAEHAEPTNLENEEIFEEYSDTVNELEDDSMLDEEPEEWLDELNDENGYEEDILQEQNGEPDVSEEPELHETDQVSQDWFDGIETEDVPVENPPVTKNEVNDGNIDTDVPTAKEIFKKRDWDWSKFKPSKAKTNSRNGFKAGVMSIIKSKSNGKRIVISKELSEKLGYPDSVQILYSEEELLIGEELIGAATSFPLKKYGAKYVIYSSSLVDEIAQELKLDYKNCVSRTLSNVEYMNDNGTVIAAIKK
jgi:hypothetical protein